MAVCLLAATTVGCDELVVINADGADRGLVILLPGIDGRSGYSEAACRALCRDGPTLSVELRDWTSPLGAFFNQIAVGRNREVARTVAVRIADYHREYPARPVYLIGHSGGTAMAVWAAESLPDGEQVEGIILLASSLSPGYDLSEALARSRGGIVSFYSPLDVAVLGAGTTLLGTMDGRHSGSAGMAGFESRGRGGYEKLFQIAWESSMVAAGHGGDHFGCMATGFIRTYVAPLVRSTQWEAGLIASVRGGKGNAPQAGTGDAPSSPAVAAGSPPTGNGKTMPDATSAEMRAAASGPSREATSGDRDPDASWRLMGDWDTFYSIGLLVTREGD
jgi:pimeloyl-ACP methyl ester carboxylesterase